MYRPDEMAMILEQVRQEAKKQQLGHIDVQKYSYNGDPSGKDQFRYPYAESKYDVFYVHISRDIFSVRQDVVKKIEATVSWNGEVTKTEINLEQLLFEGGDFGGIIFQTDGDAELADFPLILVDPEGYEDSGEYIPKGISVRCVNIQDENIEQYISLIETQTIHPIPQEYIPPLDRLVLNGADGNQYALTITDGAISVAPVTT